jgi:hypothetical protein
MDLKVPSQISVLISNFLAFVFRTISNVNNVTVYRKILLRLHNSMRHCFIVMYNVIIYLVHAIPTTRHDT